MKLLYRVLSSVCLLLLMHQVTFAQGWIRSYPDTISTGLSMGLDVVQAANGDYITCGNSSNGTYFVRTDMDGDTIWTKTVTGSYGAQSLQLLSDGSIVAVVQGQSPVHIVKLDGAGNLIFDNDWGWSGGTYPASLRATTDGGFIVAGTSSTFGTNGGSGELFLAKTDALGDTVWTATFGDSLSDNGNEVRQTTDGGYIAIGTVTAGGWGSYTHRMYVVKVDANGNLVWEQKLSQGVENWYGYSIQQTSDGGYIAAGSSYDTTQANGNFRVMLAVKLDATGNIDWRSDALNADLDCAALDVIQNADNSYILTGYYGNFQGGMGGFPEYRIPVVKLTQQGNTEWTRFFFNDYYTVPRVRGEAIKQTSDGGWIVGGTNHIASSFADKMALIKMDTAGYAVTTGIRGNVYADLNDDCDLDTLEYPLQNWVVVATEAGGNVYYANTDSAGNYAINCEYGTYVVTLAVPNPYWDTICHSVDTVVLNTPFQMDTVNWPVSALVPCPLLHVDIQAFWLRLCNSSYYYVNYCNWGMQSAQNAYIQVQFDSFTTYNASAVPAVHLGNNLYQFDLGTVNQGVCGNFYIDVTIDCDTNIAGMTHCAIAHIYPDSICNSNWTGPNLNLDVNCLGDSVHFLVRNTGGNMTGSLGYSIFEDNVMMRTGSYNLQNGQVEDIYVPTQGGKSYRIEARQDPLFPPLLGDTLIGLSLEGCTVDSSGNISTGFVTIFSNYDGSPFIDIDCQPNVGSFDPNDKLAFPTGYGPEHYIEDYTDLEYVIRFQNTGTDTAFRVVIIDTLSEHLDVTSLNAGAASHHYTYEIYGNGIVKFTFENIMLPDSGANEYLSHGFIKYTIEQKANNPVGTIINNFADIYFDINAPVRTNTTFHEIGQDFVVINLVGIEDVELPNVDINVYPNPFHESATVEIDGGDFDEIEFELYDMTGRQLYHKATYNTTFQINKPDLPQGMYIYRIVADGKLLNTGKLMVK